MRDRTSLKALLLAVPALMISATTLAQVTNLSADQRPVASDIRGRGIARYAVTSDGTRSLLNNTQRYAINLPAPINVRIGITDEESAALADVELWLATAAGEVYARCQLNGGDEVNVSPAGVEHVSYKLTVRESADRIRGDACVEDISIDPGDIQPNTGIMPMVADGDIAKGVVIVDGVPVDALSGVFE